MPTTRIIELTAQQPPFPYGLDANKRCLHACNFHGRVDSIAAGTKVALKLIEDAGLGTPNVSLFVGPTGVVPDVDTPVVTVTRTSGLKARETHNSDRYESLSFQVMVRARRYADAEDRINAIYLALDSTYDVDVTTI